MTLRSLLLACGLTLVTTMTTAQAEEPKLVLVEAESFRQLGGWVVDQQSMEVMGSPYLLAHGLGQPVANAGTKVEFPAAGTYRVWARTRDWVAPHGPGKFRLRVNGQPMAKVFGAEGDGSWQWHDGGTVRIEDRSAALELEDLTGFEGRCDALLFGSDAPDGFRPPNSGKELAAFRRKLLGLPAGPADGGEYDFVVVGGGYAGVCAAIASARLGLKVALIQDRPVLGGNASSEVRVGPIGGLNEGPYPHNADIVKEIHKSPGGTRSSGGLRARPNDPHLLEMVEAEKNISLFLEMHAFAVEMDGPRVKAVLAKHIRTSEERRFRGALFADCTGDGTVGFLAGADWRMGREGRDQTGEALAPKQADKMVLGMSNFWTARRTDQPATFPACPWALRITQESLEVPTPKYPPEFGQYAYVGGWNWESGFNRDPIMEAELVRDHNLRAIYGTWDFLKNRGKDKEQYATAKLEWAAYLLGKRESRRLLGDVILAQQDMVESKEYPDACVTATWYFDLHFPHPDNTKSFPGEEFRSLAYDDPNFEELRGSIEGECTRMKPYPIPYRCFYSRNVPNLFMAGRNISVTHVGLAPVRVMNTTGMMGTVVGRAAYLCRKFNLDPRGLYEKRLEDFKRLLAKLPTKAELGAADPKGAFVRVSPRDARYFELSDGSPYVPIGFNLVPPPEPNEMPGVVDTMARNGVNYCRIWLDQKPWNIEHARSGEYDGEKAKALDQFLALCRARGIRVKMCIEYFRDIPPEKRDPAVHGKSAWTDKPMHHVRQGGAFQGMDDFLTSQRGRSQFKGKLKWYADRYGSDPAVFAWELWNEMNCVKGPWLPWTQEMLPELHRLFPRNLAVQSLGSFDNAGKRQEYRRLCELGDNDVAQVHRYLDLAAKLEVCHGPVDVLAADAVAELRAMDGNKPAILTETGAVKPAHTGASELYEKDRDGTLLHDMLFAPFFSGAAGTGHVWFWRQAIDQPKLWHHFARFAAAVEGIDPAAEAFEPVQMSQPPLRIYALKGKRSWLAWCRDGRTWWQTELMDGKKPDPVDGESLDLRNAGLRLEKAVFRLYDPWTDKWTDGRVADGKLALPTFTRSLVIRAAVPAGGG